MSKELTPSFELLPKSKRVIQKNVAPYFVLLVIPYLLTTFGAASISDGNLEISPLILIGTLASLIFYAPLMYLLVHTSKGKTISLDETFAHGFRYFWRLIGLSILVGLIVMAGLIFFIVPGIIFLRRYFLAPYYLVDQNLKIGEAMKRSAEQSKPFSGSIYGVLGLTFLIGLMGIIPVLGYIASAIFQVLYYAAPAIRYHEVKAAYKAL